MTEHRWLYGLGIGAVAWGTASLLVPLYVVHLGGNSFDLGLLAAAAALLGTPGAVVWGRLADRTDDPRGLVVASFLATGLALVSIPFLPWLPLVVAANAVLWLVAGAAGPVLTLLIVSGVPAAEWHREIALFNRYQGLGWAGGLAVGGVWTALAGGTGVSAGGYRTLFLGCGVAAGLAAGLMSLWMPAPRTTAVTRPESRRVERLLVGSHLGVKANALPFTPTRLYWRLRGVRLSRLVGRFTPTLAWYFLAVVLFFVGFAAFFAPLPLYLTGLDLGPGVVFGLYLVSSLGSAVCYTAAGELAGRHDVRTLHAAALGLRGVAIPVVAVVGAVVSAAALRLGGVVLLFVVVGVTWAVIGVTASTIVTRVAPATVRGEALGVYAALSTLAGGIGSLLGGALAARFGFLVTFAAAGLAVLAAAALIVRLREISTSAAGDRAAERPHPASAGESPR